jgi:hypothetical protein
VRAFNSVTLVEEWLVNPPEHGIPAVAIGDANGDGARELVYASGYSSTGEDRVYVADLATRALIWSSIHLDGPFAAPQRGDVDGDGRPEIVTASWEADSGYDSGRIVVLDGVTLKVRAISAPIAGNQAFEGLHDLKLRNVDGDPALEIVVAADRLYDGVIEIYDFTAAGAFTVAWTNATRPSGSPFFTVDVADVDADGVLEVVGSVGRAHTGSPGTFLYVYSLATGAEEWHSFALTTGWLPADGLAVLTGGGGVADIVVMVGGETLNIFSGTGTPQAIIPGPFRYLAPMASATPRQFVIGGDGGDIRVYERQGSGYGVGWSRVLGGPAVTGVTWYDAISGMAVASGGRLTLFPQRDGPPAWTSEDYGLRGPVVLGAGPNRRPFAGGRYAMVSLAPWRTLFDVTPAQGRSGTFLTATGASFAPGAELYVGGSAALNVQVPDATHVAGNVPALPACRVYTVMAINPDMSYELKEDAFTVRKFGGALPPCLTR